MLAWRGAILRVLPILPIDPGRPVQGLAAGVFAGGLTWALSVYDAWAVGSARRPRD